MAGGIPCKSRLRSEVSIRLPHRIPQSWNQSIQLGKSWNIAVGSASISDVTQTIGEGQIWSDLPAISYIYAQAVVRT